MRENKEFPYLSTTTLLSQSYQTFFFENEEFFCVLLLSLSVCSLKNIVCTLKWPSLKSKNGKMKKSKFGRIDS